ncbi:MAG TPA: response regulator [Mucilaginibacter sp.]|jgi:CheY-like chemotaxis protein|nr:response regulator [Mucilaginibacter sp.]
MRSINTLLVEDNEGDILLTTEAFDESKIINKIIAIRNGKQVINFFESLGQKEETLDLVLLDINLPKLSGHDVLTYIKNNEEYASMPVNMLTTSSLGKAILQSYKNHVNCYITKLIDVVDFMKAIARIEDFWINIVTLPVK